MIETGIEIASETEIGKETEIEMDGAEGKVDLRREEDNNTPLAGKGKEGRERKKKKKRSADLLFLLLYLGSLENCPLRLTLMVSFSPVVRSLVMTKRRVRSCVQNG